MRFPAASISDDMLVTGVLAGREEAFVALMERYHRPLIHLARHFVRDDALAEDVVQDTWIGFLRGVEKFERRSTFRTWLFRVLTNRAKTRALKEARYVPIDQGEHAEGPEDGFDEAGAWRVPPAEWRITPERLFLSAEVRSVVDATLRALPAGQRAVVELRDIEGFDAADVCNILGISETNQRVLLHRGRTRLRGALAARLE